MGTYERAQKTGIASGLACGSNLLLTARRTPRRPRTFADTRHQSPTRDNMSKVVISSYGTSTRPRFSCLVIPSDPQTRNSRCISDSLRVGTDGRV